MDNWTALFNTIALFRGVATELGDHLGYPYPRKLDERIITYLQSIWSDVDSKR